jgi:gliding motility-associated-like protein
MAGKVYALLIFLMLCLKGYSQCGDNLGIPVVNETFGSGTAEIGPQLPAGVTDLQFSGTTCPFDGQYSIIKKSAGCYSDDWHVLTDHTGGGYFMLINAAEAPSNFFVQKVSGLCGGTSYVFSAWIVNMIEEKKGFIEPNVSFSISSTDGTILKEFNTGDIPVTNPAKWTEYSFMFTTPEGISDVVLRMRNNAPGGNGNDLGLDDIRFTPAGPDITLIANGVNAAEVEYPCSGGLQLTSNVATCYVQNAYQWQQSTDDNIFTDIQGANGSSNLITLSAPGTYYYRLCVAGYGNIESPACRVYSNAIKVTFQAFQNTITSIITAQTCQGTPYILPSGKAVYTAGSYTDTLLNKAGCDSTITQVNLEVLDRPTKPNLGRSANLCLGDSLTLNAGTFMSYLWQDGSTAATYQAKSGGVYWVKVSDVNGCFSADTVVITQIYCSPIRPPSAFTPNGDGINDLWNIEGLQYFLNCTVMVYNRSGQQVFKSTGYSQPWDGRYGARNLPPGTYYYVINLKNNSPPITGPVTIIR